MPGLDRTGPFGDGPRTGRALGRCNPDNKENDHTEEDERGLGQGNRLQRGADTGIGQGRRMGRGNGPGRGRGRRGRPGRGLGRRGRPGREAGS